MPWQRIRRLFPMELQSFGDKSLKWYRHKILANNHIDSAAAAVVSKMTWHDPSTSLKFSSFSMRDLKRPLKRITYSKIRVFSQNWFCGGDICVSGLICLSCSLLVSLTLHTDCHNVTSIHSWVNNLLLLLYLLILLSKTKHFSMYRHEYWTVWRLQYSQPLHRQASDWILFCLHEALTVQWQWQYQVGLLDYDYSCLPANDTS